VFPERETPFFIMFTAGLCTFTALIAFLTHQYPDHMAVVAKTVRFSMQFFKFGKKSKIHAYLLHVGRRMAVSADNIRL